MGGLKPKVEYSPNSLAKCNACRGKIYKQNMRFGIPAYTEHYNKHYYRYYHAQCCPPALQAMVPKASEELNRRTEVAQNKQRFVVEHQDLLQSLKRLRSHLANRQGVPLYMVFSNATLEELVVRMPTNDAQLLSVNGIGPSKLHSYGGPILALIQKYAERLLLSQASIKAERKPAARSLAHSAATDIAGDDSDSDGDDGGDGDDRDDGPVEMGKTLTSEELVNQKFEQAAANGNVISLND
jgi:HRDC domain